MKSIALAVALAAADPSLPPMIELKALGASDRPKTASSPMQAGLHRSLPKDAIKRGRWMSDRVWRLGIKSPGAEGLRVHFRDFALKGGTVTIGAATSKPEVVGPYTAAGPNRNGDFWSDLVFADTVVIEYKPAPGVRGSSAPPFRIPEITHIWPH